MWEGDYCAGGCGYWDDFRNDDEDSRWHIYRNIYISSIICISTQVAAGEHQARVGGDGGPGQQVRLKNITARDSTQLLSTLCYRVNNYKYFDDMIKNSCEGGDWRCIGAEGPCGCWRNDHTFPADTVCDV